MVSAKKLGIIIQARTGSTRLPGKVLKRLSGITVLEHIIQRLQITNLPIIVATTTNPNDDLIVDESRNLGVYSFRGSENNVLERYFQCAKENNLQVIVRICSDCPLIDGELINKALQKYSKNYSDYLYLNLGIPRSYPLGVDFEIFSFSLLQEAYQNARTESQREHVTPYINQNISGKVQLMSLSRKVDASQYRLTLDTPEDFELIKILIEEFNCHQKSVEEILEVLEQNPELARINGHVEQKKV